MRGSDKVFRWILAVIIVGLAAGCSGNGAGGEDAGDAGGDGDADRDYDNDHEYDDDDGGGSDEGSQEVSWNLCRLDPDSPMSKWVECAMIEVPLRHAESDGPKIEIWVQRLLGTAAQRRGQIWFLSGGPGDTGASFAYTFDRFSTLAPEWDLYTLDHRGVGFSARLGCPQQEANESEAGYVITEGEWPGCLQHLQDTWGADLAEFTATAAAADVGMIIERVREPGKQVYVYSLSYGTYWAIRYLQLYPQQADGVILDSIAPSGFSFYNYDVFINDIGEDFIEYCANDALCSSKLGADPWATIGRVFADVEAGSCPGFSALVGAGDERHYLRLTLGNVLAWTAIREFVPAVVYRLNRCDPEDVDALKQLLTVLFPPPAVPSAYMQRVSMCLSNHVKLSELWEDPLPDPAAVAAREASLYFSFDVAPELAALQDMWPSYPRDQYVHNWPDTQVPLLMMNGDLDPATPPWEAALAADHFTGAHQYYYAFPRCGHVLIEQSPVQTPGQQNCAVQMLFDFVDDPQTPPDSACLSDLLPVEFTADPAYIQWLFGTEDMWENNTRRGIPTPAKKPPGFDRVVRELRGIPPPAFLR